MACFHAYWGVLPVKASTLSRSPEHKLRTPEPACDCWLMVCMREPLMGLEAPNVGLATQISRLAGRASDWMFCGSDPLLFALCWMPLGFLWARGGL